MNPLIRLAGGVVCVALGALSAVYEAFYSNILWGLPSMVAAFFMCLALTHFAWYTVGTRWAPVFAIVPWLTVMVAAVSPRPEGDGVILGSSWGGALTAVLGMVGFAVPYFRAPRRPRPLAPGPFSRSGGPAAPSGSSDAA